MEWNAENIRQLRSHAQITQAQLATWLGVTVKQVKHLENRRRNPSGPVERLLDIYTKEREQANGQAVKILSTPHRKQPEPRPQSVEENLPADDAMVWSR